VSEVESAAFAGTRHEITGRLVVRRVLDANTQNPLFPVWRYHPFVTNNPEPVADADLTHRRHAICETVWFDLIDGPWAHQPSGSFAANAAWTILAAITHNLLRAAGTLTSTARYAVARGATLRSHLVNVPGPPRPASAPARAAPTRALAPGQRLAAPLASGLRDLTVAHPAGVRPHASQPHPTRRASKPRARWTPSQQIRHTIHTRSFHKRRTDHPKLIHGSRLRRRPAGRGSSCGNAAVSTTGSLHEPQRCSCRFGRRTGAGRYGPQGVVPEVPSLHGESADGQSTLDGGRIDSRLRMNLGDLLRYSAKAGSSDLCTTLVLLAVR
jgi:hypothetical protein